MQRSAVAPLATATRWSNLAAMAFDPARAVLAEQRAAVRALGRLDHPGRQGPGVYRPLSAGQRSKLVELSVAVLTEAALAADAECRRIVAAAEAQAAAIVQKARDDVTRLNACLGTEPTGRGPTEPTGRGPTEPTGRGPTEPDRDDASAAVLVSLPVVPGYLSGVGHGGAVTQEIDEQPQPHQPQPQQPQPQLPLPGVADYEGDADAFFESFAPENEDPWCFLDDDSVGVGPAIRRALRRPAGLRRQPVA